MKRILMLALSLIFVVTMSACGNNDGGDKDPVVDPDNGVNDNVDPSNDDVDTNSNNGVNDNADTNSNDVEENQNENADQDNDTTSALSGFEEEKTVEEHIDELDALKVIVETDNPNKRIIIYKDGNQVQYKSIFVKDNNHLKIINTHDDEDLLFDGTIE